MDKLDYIGTVDAGFIHVRVGVFTVEQEIDVSVVIGRGQLFHFTLNPKEADLLSTRLLRVCESTLDCSDTFETPSVHFSVSSKDQRIGVSVVCGRDAVFHFTVNPVHAQKLSNYLAQAVEIALSAFDPKGN
jgi:hypothetical protein